MMLKDRKDVVKQDRWAVEDLYENFESWKKSYQSLAMRAEGDFAEFTCFKGNLGHVETLFKCLNQYFALSLLVESLYVYAHLRFDEDLTNEEAKGAFQSISMLYHAFVEKTSWIEPELLQANLEQMIKEPTLKQYKNYLKKILHQKPHILSSPEEKILAASSDPIEMISRAFSSLNNADLKFKKAIDEEGKEHELTHASFQFYLKSKDRTLRKSAFLNIHETFGAFQNTISDLLAGSVKKHLFHANVRGYRGALEAALFVNDIPVSVYHNLIKTTNANLSVLHRYIALRKKTLKLSELHAYDLFVPLTKDLDVSYSFDESVNIILASLKPLGAEYLSILEKGLKEDRWVDRYENKNKRSGAYSSGSYQSKPFILMNYKGAFSDLMTLTHEAGHSMHSYYSNHNNSFEDAQYTIFVAEVASTFHEELAFRYLYQNAKTKEEKIFILSQKIDSLRSTFFRQTMFAEFELKIHEMAKEHEPLTPGALKKVYEDLNRSYFGADFHYDESLFYEFLRIPHFYSNFYVYQYATGISAAFALVERVMNEGGLQDYLNFLSSGGRDFPVNLLKKAGVDMTEGKVVEGLIARFAYLVKELENLI